MKITKHQRNLILAMALGDGHVTNTPRYSHNPRLRIEHAESQLGYLQWKVNLLPKSWRTKINIRHKDYSYKGVDSTLVSYWHVTKSLSYLRLIRRVLYGKTRNRKIITPKIVDRIGILGLMIWYMDDGNLHDRGPSRGYQVRMYTFQTKEENQLLIDYFKDKYDVKFYQCRRGDKYILECGSVQARKFIGLFSGMEKPECMKYKFDVVEDKYPRKGVQGESLEDIV